MSPFFAHNAGMIELVLIEGIVLVVAARELWSVRRSLRRDRTPEAPPLPAADQDVTPASADSGGPARPAGHPEGE